MLKFRVITCTNRTQSCLLSTLGTTRGNSCSGTRTLYRRTGADVVRTRGTRADLLAVRTSNSSVTCDIAVVRKRSRLVAALLLESLVGRVVRLCGEKDGWL